MVQKEASVIHENSVNDQSQGTNRRVLIKAVAETDQHYHVPPLNIHVSEAPPTEGKHSD